MIENQYIAFSAVYRYPHYRLQLAEQGTMDEAQLSAIFLNLYLEPKTQFCDIAKESLVDNFAITDKDSLLHCLDTLHRSDWLDSPVQALLMQIYLSHPHDFAELSVSYLEQHSLSDAQLQPVIERFQPVTGLLDKDHDTQQQYREYLRQRVLQYFAPQQGNDDPLATLAAVYQQHPSWLTGAAGFAISGFNHSRIIDIISTAAIAGLLDTTEAEVLLLQYGRQTEQLFPDWPTFLYSCLLGKQLLVPHGGAHMLGSDDYCDFIRGLVVDNNQTLHISGIWPDSDFQQIAADLNAQMTAGEKLLQQFAAGFRSSGMDYLWRPNHQNEFHDLITDTVEPGQADFLEQTTNAFFFNLSAGEVPFISTITGLFKYGLITSHGIHLCHRPWIFFGPMRKRFIPWQEPMSFSVNFPFSREITIRVNKLKVLTVEAKLDRYQLDEDKALEMSTKQLRQLFQPDMDGLLAGFNAFRQQQIS